MRYLAMILALVVLAGCAAPREGSSDLSVDERLQLLGRTLQGVAAGMQRYEVPRRMEICHRAGTLEICR